MVPDTSRPAARAEIHVLTLFGQKERPEKISPATLVDEFASYCLSFFYISTLWLLFACSKKIRMYKEDMLAVKIRQKLVILSTKLFWWFKMHFITTETFGNTLALFFKALDFFTFFH